MPSVLKQKNIISMKQFKTLAEINYFSNNLSEAMKYDQIFLKHFYEQFTYDYYKNHLAAYTYFTMINCTANTAKLFYYNLLDIVKNNMSNKLYADFSLLIFKQIDILNGNIIDYIENDAYVEPKIYLESKDFFKQFFNSQIKNNQNEMLSDFLFIYKYGCPEDYIRYYEEYNDLIDNFSFIHINAAKIYLYLNDPINAKKALKNYVIKNGNRIPMPLFVNYSLYELYSSSFFKELLYK